MPTMKRPKPNLFVIGAAKSGTTSLHHHLSRHPEIHMSEPKEPGFFAPGFDYYPKDEDWYLGLFADGKGKRYRGESSTHYTKLPVYSGVADAIAAYCEKPCFIYLMRDPIDRAISHYWHNTRQNVEFRSPLRAIEESPEYRAFGDYARQLEPFLDTFGRDALFVTTFEKLVTEPEQVTSDIFRWLELDPSAAPRELPARNTAPRTIQRFLGGQRLGTLLHQSEIWNAISPLVPQPIKDAGKRATIRSVRPAEIPMDDVARLLRPWAADCAKRVGALLDREFPEWKTTVRPS